MTAAGDGKIIIRHLRQKGNRMIHVGLCDDKKSHREMESNVAEKALFQYDEIEFYHFSSGDEVIESIENEEFFCEILFLDIHMDGLNGLETAAYIREHQVDVDIIFITVSKEHVFDGYTYQAFSYLVKPFTEERLLGELKRYMELRQKKARCLHVSINGKKTRIFLDRVRYFTSDGRKVFANLTGEEDEIVFYAKMGDLQEKLAEEGFVRCHQSYLVNELYVKSYARTELDLGDEIIPVSRKYAEDVKKKIEQI